MRFIVHQNCSFGSSHRLLSYCCANSRWSHTAHGRGSSWILSALQARLCASNHQSLTACTKVCHASPLALLWNLFQVQLILGKNLVLLSLLFLSLFDLLLKASMLFFHLSQRLLVVNDLFNQQVSVFFLARKFDFQVLFLLLKSSMLPVKLLCHVRHELELLIERLLAQQRVFIAVLLLKRVVPQVLLPLGEPHGAHLPELLLAAANLVRSLALQLVSFVVELIDQVPQLLHLFAIRQLFVELLASVGTFVAQFVKSVVIFTDLILLESQVDVFHLELVLTLRLYPFEGLLALGINPMLQIGDHLSVLLLAEDVVLQLIALDLFETLRLPECVDV